MPRVSKVKQISDKTPDSVHLALQPKNNKNEILKKISTSANNMYIPKSKEYRDLEYAHLEYSFQCNDIEESYNPDRTDLEWAHFTDGETAVLGLLYRHENETDLVLRRPIGKSLSLLVDIEKKYTNTNNLRIEGLSKEQLIEFSKTSTNPFEEIALDAIQGWENGVNQTNHYLPKERGIVLFKKNYEWQDITLFDPQVTGKNYKTIRKSVNKAKRDGLSFKPAEDTDLPELQTLYDQWEVQLIQKGERSYYENPYIEEKNPLFKPYLVRDKDERTLAWTTLFTRGKYAYMLKRFALKHTSRPADFMDYNIFCLIKDQEIERLDRGMALNGALNQYKSKIAPLNTETLFDISLHNID